MTVRAATGLLAEHVGSRCLRGEGIAGRVWETGESLTVPHYSAWVGRLQDLDDSLQLYAVIAVPLRAGTEVVGVIGLAEGSPGRTFDERTLGLLSRFGRLASLAYDNARLFSAAQAEVEERRRAERSLQGTVVRLERSERELEHSRQEMIRRLAFAIEFRDEETSRHVERMSRTCTLLARRLGLDERRCELIGLASPLHDIGKIAVPDEILLKPGPLSSHERALIERHAEIGHRMLAGSGSELLELAATIAWTHHERYDGCGYPRRLAGEQIPLEGRIATVADVFDALTSDRVYRPAYPPAEARARMAVERRRHFDPLVLDLFLELSPRISDEPTISGEPRLLVDPSRNGRSGSRTDGDRPVESPQAVTDRARFETRVAEELQRAERAGRGLSLLRLDCRGVAATDGRRARRLSAATQRALQDALAGAKRAEDVAVALSPGQLALLLPETDGEAVEAAAERVADELRCAAHRTGHVVYVRCGRATYPADGRTAADLMGAAESALRGCRSPVLE